MQRSRSARMIKVGSIKPHRRKSDDQAIRGSKLVRLECQHPVQLIQQHLKWGSMQSIRRQGLVGRLKEVMKKQINLTSTIQFWMDETKRNMRLRKTIIITGNPKYSWMIATDKKKRMLVAPQHDQSSEASSMTSRDVSVIIKPVKLHQYSVLDQFKVKQNAISRYCVNRTTNTERFIKKETMRSLPQIYTKCKSNVYLSFQTQRTIIKQLST